MANTKIFPIGADDDLRPRPLWSVMIPTYNCAGYLRETLACVLAQDPGPEIMQIEVVDDHSTADDPEAVVREIGRGRVDFFRQPRNLGHVANFNTCLQRARGELVHLLHGDDCVRPGFYDRLNDLFVRYPHIGAAFCRVITMDEQSHWRQLNHLLLREPGLLPDRLEVIAAKLPIETPCVAVRRTAYEDLGGFDDRFRYCGEDQEMWVRIAARYPFAYEPSPLALYRKHIGSLSGVSIRSGKNIRETAMAIELYRAYLPPRRAEEITRRSRERVALWALDLARKMVERGDPAAAGTQLIEALRCSRSSKVLREASSLAPPLLRRALSGALRRGKRRPRNVPALSSAPLSTPTD
jgi:hypothetical protein